MPSDGETQYFKTTHTLSPSSSPAGTSIPLTLAYRTFGSPSNPSILMPTCYGGRIADTLPLLYDGPSAPFPPTNYHIIIVGLLGGSESSSPSNTPAPHAGPTFPHTSYEDNIRLQHLLCTEHLRVQHLEAYIGFSMGGQQAYHMSVLFPGFASNIVVLAGSARTSWHNWSFLEGPKAALVNSVDFFDGEYADKAATKDARGRGKCVRGTRAFGRTYSTWALSQEWYRQRCWEVSGHKSLEEYLEKGWEDGMETLDAHDLLCMLRTWQQGDVTRYHPEDGGDLGKTLGRVTAKVLVMPSRTDAYFPPEDNEREVESLKRGKYLPIESIWGHMAGGGGGTKEDGKFICEEIKKFVDGG